MQITGKTIAITGATGFLGGHITEALLDAGAKVVGVVRTPSKGAWLAERGVVMRRADLGDRDSLTAAFQGADAVVSNAALGSNQGELEDFVRVNCEGVDNTFDAAAAAGVSRVVHISTTAVYQNRLWRRMDESAEPLDTTRRRFNPADVTTDWRYARTKRIAEDRAWSKADEHGIALTALRPGPIYGSRDHKATAQLLGKLEKAVLFTPTVGVPWVHARDVGDVVRSALEQDASIGRAFNLTGEPVSHYTFMRALKRAKGQGGWIVPIPLPLWVRYDCSAARETLGFSPRPIDEGLAEALAP